MYTSDFYLETIDVKIIVFVMLNQAKLDYFWCFVHVHLEKSSQRGIVIELLLVEWVRGRVVCCECLRASLGGRNTGLL